MLQRWDETNEMMCKKDEECRWKISSYYERNERAEALSLMKRSEERCSNEGWFFEGQAKVDEFDEFFRTFEVNFERMMNRILMLSLMKK